jgi:hypothetical protein
MSSLEEISETANDVEISCGSQHEFGLDICAVSVVPHQPQHHTHQEGPHPIKHNHPPLRDREEDEGCEGVRRRAEEEGTHIAKG